MIVFNNVVKYYNKKSYTKELNFQINLQAINLIIGGNGSGKSTSLKLICKFILLKQTDRGKIVNDFKKIAFLPEKTAIPLHGMVNEYLKNVIKIYDVEDKIDYYLNLFNLKNTALKTLSKGMMQKVCIIHTLLLDADLYVYDEPLDGIDENAAKTFIKCLNEKVKKGKTVIIATHKKDVFLKYASVN